MISEFNPAVKEIAENVRWVIEKEYPLQTPEEALALLVAGYTLINNEGYIVYLEKKKQVKSNPKREFKDYRFTRPCLWQILKSRTGSTINIVDNSSFLVRANVLLKSFTRGLYNECRG